MTFVLSAARTLWGQALLPEIYSFHIFFVALVFFLGYRYSINPCKKGVCVLSFVYGIALTNHLLILFIIPMLLFWIGLRTIWFIMKNGGIFHCMVFFLVGLSINIYLPIRSSSHPVLDWGSTRIALNFINHLTGSQFHSSMFALPLQVIFLNIKRIMEWMWVSLPLYYLIFVFTGIIFIKKKPVILMVLVTGILMLTGISNYDIPDIDNYYVGLALFTAIPAVFGIQFIVNRICWNHPRNAFFLSL
ncbi:MAG: hypothetical protein A2161_04995 [Candidatus Schekmanbacteria bacterium RBG_13_48_7]|uniref:Glycosyltransferase RgtA/B/C/D-like domain-containing protein n=1 Tax=Candidatus Schekmanbacteria bacterium RBG_13_48_7 TaxID=1817878 RepID=A0A1F7RZC5_9BACT|nr:MAG: hypothetical protein A2161_04995 [Candidatus Schekmanbacteria bacterium RBG_13_48_7]